MSEMLSAPYDQHHSEDDFRIIRVIGKGSLGKVMLVQEKSSGEYFALKSIKKSDLPTEKQRKVARQERDLFVERLLECNSPFLVKMYAAFQSETHLFYLLKYYPGGDLATMLAQNSILPEPCVNFYAAQLVLGLEALRKLGIVYRDLKPENIVFSQEGHLVLVDFGLSKLLENSKTCSFTNTFCGTAEYLAPEILLGQPYGFEVDLWSLGTMIYEMLVGTPPYWAEHPQEMYQNIVNARPIVFPRGISHDASGLIRHLLHFSPKDRIGYYSISEIKAHPFFDGFSWESMVRLEISPPFHPITRDVEDVAAFDATFTSMTPAITPNERCYPAAASIRNYFSGFTFGH